MDKHSKIYELKVWGDYACFTRPEFKVERVSYDVITPSAARAIFECISWDHAIKWVIDEISVSKPIKLESIMRNESGKGKINTENTNYANYEPFIITENRQQRTSLILKNVEYLVKAHFEVTKNPVGQVVEEPDCKNESDIIAKFQCIFERRARRGKYFYAPYLGCREFPANYELIDSEESARIQPIEETRDLGVMLWDMSFYEGFKETFPIFFHAYLKRGKVYSIIENADGSKEFKLGMHPIKVSGGVK